MRMEFRQVAKDADDIVEWFRTFDLNVHNSRIERYAKLVHEIAAKIRTSSPEGLSADSINHIKTLYEYGELAVIYRAFKSNPPAGLNYILEKVVSGPFSYVDETSQNSSARNFAFEANLGSRLDLAMLPVSFVHTGDVKSEFENVAVYFQCKRLTSSKQARKRVSAACKQIKRDIQNHSGSSVFGFVGLDITKVCDENELLLSDDSVSAIESRLSDSRKRFINDHLDNQNISFGKRTIGVLVRNACICLIENDDSYMFIQGYTVATKPRMSPDHKAFSNRFYKRLTAKLGDSA